MKIASGKIYGGDEMPRAKRHHLVPQVYLRRFGDERGRIAMVDVEKSVSIVTTVGNVAVEGNFYTVQVEDNPSDRLEQRHLSRVEGLIGRAFTGLDHGWPPVGLVRSGLANFCALQIVRGREFRDWQTHAFDKAHKDRFRSMSRDDLRKQLTEAQGAPPSEDELDGLYKFMRAEEYTVGTEQTFHLLGMLDVGADLVEPLSRMRWDLLEIQEGDEVEFVTCDEPVVRWAEHDSARTAYFKMGIFKADEITVALDRRRMLAIRPGSTGRGRKRFVTGIEAGELNQRTVTNARRYFFSHPEGRPHPFTQG